MCICNSSKFTAALFQSFKGRAWLYRIWQGREIGMHDLAQLSKTIHPLQITLGDNANRFGFVNHNKYAVSSFSNEIECAGGCLSAFQSCRCFKYGMPSFNPGNYIGDDFKRDILWNYYKSSTSRDRFRHTTTSNSCHVCNNYRKRCAGAIIGGEIHVHATSNLGVIRNHEHIVICEIVCLAGEGVT